MMQEQIFKPKESLRMVSMPGTQSYYTTTGSAPEKKDLPIIFTTALGGIRIEWR